MLFFKRMPSSLQRRKVSVSSRNHRRYWVKSPEAIHHDLIAAVDRWVCKDSLIWDISANLGMLAFAAAGHVYAFEADLEMAALMFRSLSGAIQNEGRSLHPSFAIGCLGRHSVHFSSRTPTI
jgi:hypothetical protein